MSAKESLAALEGVTTANGVSVVAQSSADPADPSGSPVAGRVLPTRAEFAAVLPWPGLRRGSTVAVSGSIALLFALLAEATSNGSWAAIVGMEGLGLTAAAEAGIVLSRLALIPRPGKEAVGATAALLDGVDLVAVSARHIADSDARRLSARARHRGSVLLPFGSWPGADVVLGCSGARWYGLGRGHGRLRQREITVRASGRGAAARARACRLLLPGDGGAVSSVTSDVRELHTTPGHGSAAPNGTASLRVVAG